MSIGVYGVKRPADVDPSDIEVIVIYTKTRNSTDIQTVTKLFGNQVIRPMMSNSDIGGTDLEILGGLYNLTLPRNVFNQKGFYTIYLRPAQIRIKIEDCAELATYPDVKGLVFNIDQAPVDFINKFTNNGLDGYRVEYLNNDGTKIPNLYRIITSSFISEPVQINTANSSQKSIKYIYNNVGNLLFCTVTPNAAPSFKPTAAPFIGRKDQNVIITNTNFTPQMIELEMVNYDVESLAIGLFADQTKSMDDGIYTIYDFDGNIYAQYDLYEIRDNVDNKLFEVRKKRNVIDTTKSLNNIIGNNG
jgi:hypothetical protein